MKVLKLEYPEEMLLALLRAALHQREVETIHFQHVTADDWVQCFRLAVRQGVSALAWEGIERLPMEYCPPIDVKLSWALLEKKQFMTYQKHCQAVTKLTELYAQNGIATVVLKGVGLSRLYPVPAHREGGDIDIYTYSVDKNRMTDEEANRLADELIEKQGAIMDHSLSAKHSKFCFRGITFENHRKFLHEAECRTISKAEQWLKEHIEVKAVEMLGGECRIAVPSVTFDIVFVALHAAQHYGMGLSLKHLCDWGLLVQQNGANLPSELDDRFFIRTVNTLTHLCNRFLGLSIPVEGEESLVDEMMQEILCPLYYNKTSHSHSYKAKWARWMNRIHIFKLKHRLLGVSFWGKLRGFCIRNMKEGKN